MKISVAQTRPIKGDISKNIEAHKKFITLAVAHNADAIFFPELSLTGYEPEFAKDLALNQDDKILNDFQKLSNADKIVIGLGVPNKAASGIYISMIIFQPGKPRETYSKQQLHSDEFPYFINGTRQIILSIGNKKIAPAICYESLQPEHAAKANNLGAEIYVSSVAKSQNGINKGMTHYPMIAKKYAMPVLLANAVGFCDNFMSVGKSAVWNKQGELISQMDSEEEGLLIFDTETEEVIAHIL